MSENEEPKNVNGEEPAETKPPEKQPEGQIPEKPPAVPAVKFPRGGVSWIIFLGLILAMVALLSRSYTKPTPLTITQFYASLDNHQIKEVIVKDGSVVGTLRSVTGLPPGSSANFEVKFSRKTTEEYDFIRELRTKCQQTGTSLDYKTSDNIFVQLGGALYNWKNSFLEGLILTSEIAYWSFVGIFNKKGQRKHSVIQQSILIGVDALGIISLLSIIIGLILALQSAAQLRQFGANIFIADLIAISMVREMGPMMTAIIVAGRSGSAIASEIATMKVTEEIDALKMMAINPIRYVVVPKFHAITICMPLLVTMSMLVGILGGLIIAMTYLDLSAVSFLNRVLDALTIKDVLVGLSKSVFFSWVIVIIGSYYGFNVKGGAEGVGKATTLSVVASIFAVIILDAVFSFLYLGNL